jgi:hypothetical protein
MKEKLIQPAATIAAAVLASRPASEPITGGSIKNAFIEAYRALEAAESEIDPPRVARQVPLRT